MKSIKVLSVWAFALVAGGLLAGPAWAAIGSKPTHPSSTQNQMHQPSSQQPTNASTQGAHEKVALGQAAPNFTLKDAQGRSHSLADFKGKDVVLIWSDPKSPDTERLDREGTFKNLSQKFGSGVQLIEIRSDQAAAPASASEQREHILTLYDPQGTVAATFNAQRVPEAFIIDRHGALTYMGAVDNYPQSKGKAGEYKNYLDEALSSLQKGQTPAVRNTQPYGEALQPQAGSMTGKQVAPGHTGTTNQPSGGAKPMTTTPAQPGTSASPKK